MLYIGIAVSFIAAFFIGFRTKKFSFLILELFLGLGIGILNVYLYIAITPPVQAGLGIIALVPVLFILFPFLNLISALIGGIVGTLAGRKKK